MDERVASALEVLPDYLGQHVVLSASALGLGIALSLPLAVLAVRRPRLRWPILAAAGLIQTIPGLALLALFYPLLLAISAVSLEVLGIGFPALGFLPALLALTLYSMLPILRNGVAGLAGVDPAILEAADGVGMTPSQRLWTVEAPLALPVVMAGIRTAAVWTVGAATLSTPVGQTSLGNYIFSGLQTENWVWVLFGCAAAAAVALIADQLLGLIEAGAARRDRRRVLIGLAGFALGLLVVTAPLFAARRETYVIGAKNFSEQFILAEVMADRLQSRGLAVRRRDGLGSAVIYRALASGEIDAYVDYSGTLWANVLGRRDAVARKEMLRVLTGELKRRDGVVVLGPVGFENAYVLAMKADRARELGIRSISDLQATAPSMTLGGDLEFLSRPEWRALRDAYGLRFASERSYNPTFMYRALESGEAGVISAFSSDGRMAAQRLVALSDPKGAVPSYDAVVLISPRRAGDRQLRLALEPLIGRIRVEQMRRANLMVDRDDDKRTPAEAARWLERATGLHGR
jgi:osmoprotectant transport system permease protein